MAVYLGNSEQLKVLIDNIPYRLIIAPSYQANSVVLLSNDNFILKDSNGLILTVKEDE